MTETDTTPEEEEEYQGTTIGEEKGKNIISEELLGQQCIMEERGRIHTVNLLKGGSSKWGNERSSLKLYIENISVKRLSDEEVTNLAEDYRACKIQECLETVLKPMKYKARHSRGGVQTVTNRYKEQGIFTKTVKAARAGPLRRRNLRGSENLQQQYF